MQSNDFAEKKRVLWDGVEIPGLVRVGEITLEVDQIEVPEFARKRMISSGIKKVPVVEMTYKISRGTDTRKYFEKFFTNTETHDCIIIRTDATGTEFARRLLPGCECTKFGDPDFDAASPKYAQMSLTFVPWDIIMPQ